MTKFPLPGVFLSALFVSATLAEDANQEVLKRFTGTWQLVSATKDGVETPADVVSKIRVVIADGKHPVYFGDQAAVKEIAFAIDVGQSPKATTDTLPDGKTIKGIYKLDGDTLTSCVAVPDAGRPKEFAAPAGSGHTLRVFKRVKP